MRYLSSHWPEWCETCGPTRGDVYVVSDQPLIEESHCANCQRVLTINSKRVPSMAEQTCDCDGQGRR